MSGRGQSVSDATGTERTDLTGIGHQRRVRLAGLTVAGRRRRPSGEKPPLPRELHRSGKLWLLAGIVVTVTWALLFAFPATADWWTRQDHRVLNWFVDQRTDGATSVMESLHALGSLWLIRPIRWGMLLVLLAFQRWRSFFAAIVAFIVVDAVVRILSDSLGRPRPLVDIIGDWGGYSHPSRPVALLGVTLVVVGLALIPKGVWRTRFLALSAVLVAFLATSLVYLGTDHPTDVVIGAMFAPAVGVLVFRWLLPHSVFPVSFHRGRAAHLEITGRRAEAITTAIQEQIGATVLEIEPFGLEGSGGSTPLRIKCESDPDIYLFAKLYARSHLRADRWYKIARTILYGTLEDEVRFQSVRRLVEYEDYILLKLKEAGLPSPEPFGFVEITPEREYAIVTEFLDGAQEMGDVEVTDEVIDESLEVVRRLWDAGLAHRDIKPANVMVQQGRVVLIDPAFATVRPSPWRQAVDLANMMIILALRSTPEHVYERSLSYFSPDDIAEAFAATKGVTIPSQSRSSLSVLKRTHGIDLVERFRELAPHRQQISIQRWTWRRVWLTAAALGGALLLIDLLIANFSAAVI